MRTIRFLLQKEFLQIFRNRSMLPIIFLMPMVQLLLLANAATFEVQNARYALIDEDQSTTSRALVDRIQASGYFIPAEYTISEEVAGEAMLRGEADFILRIPADFERDLLRGSGGSVQLVLDAVDGATAGVIQSYLTQILTSFNQEVQLETGAGSGESRIPTVQTVPSYWYNPELSYKTYMVPGILVLLVTVVGLFLSAMNVVREKEIGTIEQINVTPIRKYQFIAGKLIPFWVIALVEMVIGLAIARLVFDVPMLGNIGLVFLLTGVYLLVVLGIGLWISTLVDNQQQALFVAWFIMVIFILMSGLFTPIESMPSWARVLTKVNPVAYFIEVLRRVMLKGAGFQAVKTTLLIMLAYGVAMLSLAVLQYRKVTA